MFAFTLIGHNEVMENNNTNNMNTNAGNTNTNPTGTTFEKASRSFLDTVKNIWATRPRRLPKDQGGSAPLGGVCEGMGVRYGINPTLLRVGFVILTLASATGPLLYLLCWLVMARYGSDQSPIALFRSPKTEYTPQLLLKDRRRVRLLLWTLGIIFVLSLLGTALVGPFLLFLAAGSVTITLNLAFSLSTLLFFLAIWLMHANQPIPPRGLLNHDIVPGAPVVDLSRYVPVSDPSGMIITDAASPEPPATA